jgi:phosphoribosylamine--glycine ligase
VGYGTESRVGSEITVDEKAAEAEGARIYYAAVNEKEPGKVLTTTSRAIGVVGVAGDIGAAERRCESALAHLKGDFFVRHDIGRPEALRKKAEHMKRVRGQ